jgi:phenylacetate-CoA ligase
MISPMFNKEIYWNPLLETLPQEKLRKLQLTKFKEIFRWAYDHSKFYRKIYDEAGIQPSDIKTFEDIRKVPKIEKAMLREAQGKDPYPYGDILCVPLEDVTVYRQTSGTTGKPVYQADTWLDWDTGIESYCYALYAQGYRNKDRIFLPFGYNIFIAFWSLHYAGEKLGCEVVPGGILNTEARILKMQEIRATAIGATPSYALTMADTARIKLNLDPAKDLYVRKITVAGEPGGSVINTKRRLEEAWGAKVYDQVGNTEAGHWGWECVAQSGIHINEAFFLVEIEDIETDEPINTHGKKGKMIVTNLNRLAQPCIRFDSKDVIQWNSHNCECGRTFRLLEGGVTGRTDDITKVKGVLFAPSACEEIIQSFPELGNEYQIIVTRKGNEDKISIKLEMNPGCENMVDSVRAKLLNQLRLKTNIGYNLEFHDFGTLPRVEGKARRFKDLRHH